MNIALSLQVYTSTKWPRTSISRSRTRVPALVIVLTVAITEWTTTIISVMSEELSHGTSGIMSGLLMSVDATQSSTIRHGIIVPGIVCTIYDAFK